MTRVTSIAALRHRTAMLPCERLPGMPKTKMAARPLSSMVICSGEETSDAERRGVFQALVQAGEGKCSSDGGLSMERGAP
jgi:hypothetical protein